jgi:hypothetical protein
VSPRPVGVFGLGDGVGRVSTGVKASASCCANQEPSMPPTFPGEACEQTMVGLKEGQQLRHVEAIQVHHLGPGGNEVLDELLLCIRAAVDFRQSA